MNKIIVLIKTLGRLTLKSFLYLLLLILIVIVFTVVIRFYFTREKEFLIVYDAYDYKPQYRINEINGADTLYDAIKLHYVYNFDSQQEKLSSIASKMISQEVHNLPLAQCKLIFCERLFLAKKYNHNQIMPYDCSNYIGSYTWKVDQPNEIKVFWGGDSRDRDLLYIDSEGEQKTDLIPNCPKCKYSVQVYPPISPSKREGVD